MKAKYTTAKAIAAAITANAKAHIAVDTDWQAIGLSVMAHIDNHRDVSVVNNLVIPMYNGLGKGARHAAMTAWLLKFLPVVANTAAATKATHPFMFCKEKAKQPLDFAGAESEAWWTMKPSPAPDQVFDVRAMFLSIIRKANNAAAQGTPMVGDRAALVAAAAAFGISEADLPPATAPFFSDKDKAKEAAKLVAKADTADA